MWTAGCWNRWMRGQLDVWTAEWVNSWMCEQLDVHISTAASMLVCMNVYDDLMDVFLSLAVEQMNVGMERLSHLPAVLICCVPAGQAAVTFVQLYKTVMIRHRLCILSLCVRYLCLQLCSSQHCSDPPTGSWNMQNTACSRCWLTFKSMKPQRGFTVTTHTHFHNSSLHNNRLLLSVRQMFWVLQESSCSDWRQVHVLLSVTAHFLLLCQKTWDHTWVFIHCKETTHALNVF